MAPIIMNLLKGYPVSLNENLSKIMVKFNLPIPKEKGQKITMQNDIDTFVRINPQHEQTVRDMANEWIIEYKQSKTKTSEDTTSDHTLVSSETTSESTLSPRKDISTSPACSDPPISLQTQPPLFDDDDESSIEMDQAETNNEPLSSKRKLSADSVCECDNERKTRLVNPDASLLQLFSIIQRDSEERKRQFDELKVLFDSEKEVRREQITQMSSALSELRNQISELEIIMTKAYKNEVTKGLEKLQNIVQHGLETFTALIPMHVKHSITELTAASTPEATAVSTPATTTLTPAAAAAAAPAVAAAAPAAAAAAPAAPAAEAPAGTASTASATATAPVPTPTAAPSAAPGTNGSSTNVTRGVNSSCSINSNKGGNSNNNNYPTLLFITDSNGRYINCNRLNPQIRSTKFERFTIDKAIESIPHHAKPENVKEIIFQVGLNDLRRGLSPQDIQEKTLTMQMKYNEVFPNARQHVTAIPPLDTAHIEVNKSLQKLSSFTETNFVSAKAFCDRNTGNLLADVMVENDFHYKKYGVCLLAKSLKKSLYS